MSNAALETAIEAAWDARDTITIDTKGETRDAITETMNALDSGKLRVAERQDNGDWHVNQWAKKAVLLSFRLNDMEQISGGNGDTSWWDKVPSKFAGWSDADWRDAGFRAVPGSIVRRSAYIAPGVVLMPSFVNLGAVFIGQSTKIVDRDTGEVFYGEVPPYSVVVAGSMPSKNGVNLYCAVDTVMFFTLAGLSAPYIVGGLAETQGAWIYIVLFAVYFIPMQGVLIISALWAAKSRWVDDV